MFGPPRMLWLCAFCCYSYILCVFRCARIPRYVLVENVKGFETSSMRNELIDVLTSLDFQFRVTFIYMVTQKIRHCTTRWRANHLVGRTLHTLHWRRPCALCVSCPTRVGWRFRLMVTRWSRSM